MFKADPVRYAPQFGNFCAMALAKGEVVVANPTNWLISDGKLYVFGARHRPDPLFSKKILRATSIRRTKTGRFYRKCSRHSRECWSACAT